jgi:hypothetical protein
MPSVVAGLALACSTSTVLSQDFTICTFDADYCTVNTDNTPVPSVFYWTNDVGNPAGSVYLVINWANNPSGWQDTKLSWDIAWPGIDCPDYANVEFDVKIDQANSYPALDGSYGGVQVVCQGWQGWGLNTEAHSWVAVGNSSLIATSDWQHVTVPLTSFPWTLSRLCVNFYGNPPEATTNTICYFVDNLKLTAPPAPPPTLALQLSPKPQPGLNLFTSVAGNQWQRQNIRLASTGYGWYNSGAPTTYSFTIADFPSPGTTNFLWNFDTSTQVGDWGGWWGLTPTFTWDETNPDASDTCTNGSMYVVVPFTTAGDEQTSFRGLFSSSLDGTRYASLSFDIKVDPSSGPITSGANYGTFDAIGFAWDQEQVGTYTIPLSATNWTHVNLPINRSMAGLSNVEGFWFKMWSGSDHTNALKFWLDNVTVEAAAQGFQAHMYLAPGPNTGLPVAPDWNETNCIFVQIQGSPNGNATAAFRFKTNYPGSNGGTNIIALVTNEDCTVTTLVDDYYGACVLATITNGPVLGTWSVTFHDNTNVTFSGPGASTNFTIPAEVLDAMFANYDYTMLVYYGVGSAGTNGIGQKAIFSRAVITNEYLYPWIDDNFSAPALDTATWAISADASDGIFVVPTDAKGWLTWTLPDTGFGLQTSPDLVNPYLWGTPAFHTFVNKDVRQSLIRGVYETEMLQFDVSGGSLPEGLLIRESPTAASLGQTSIRPLAGGNYQISSFFDVYLEVSTDSGTNWLAATNGPAPLRMNVSSATNTLPPFEGQYASPSGWVGLYANGVVLSNLVSGMFSGSFPPPQLTDPTNSYSSTVEVTISTDGGAIFNGYSAAGANTEAVSAGGGRMFFRLMKPGS